jgi:hypothetical protein
MWKKKLNEIRRPKNSIQKFQQFVLETQKFRHKIAEFSENCLIIFETLMLHYLTIVNKGQKSGRGLMEMVSKPFQD